MDETAPNITGPLLSVAQVAERLGVAESTVRNITNRGELPVTLISERGLHRYTPAAVEAYIAARTRTATPHANPWGRSA